MFMRTYTVCHTVVVFIWGHNVNRMLTCTNLQNVAATEQENRGKQEFYGHM